MLRLLKLNVTRVLDGSSVFMKHVHSNVKLVSRNVNRQVMSIRNMSEGKSMPPFRKFVDQQQTPKSGIPKKRSEDKRTFLNWLDWFSTQDGRKAVYSGAIGTALTVVLAVYGANLSLPSRMQSAYVERPDGVGSRGYLTKKLENPNFDQREVPFELEMLYSTLGARAKLDEVEYEKTSVFVSELMDPVTIGMASCRDGAMIGFPRHMMYKSVEEVDLGSVYFKPFWLPFYKGYKVEENADSELVKELKENLVLSKGAREFIVSHCMNMGTQLLPYIISILPGVAIMTQYFIGYRVNNNMNLFKVPRWMRLGIQSLICLTTWAMYANFHSLAKQTITDLSLTMVVSTSEQADAAIEYYQKCLKRNQILRKLLGEESHYYFKEDGEYIPSPYELPNYLGYQARIDTLTKLKERLLALEKARRKSEEK